MVTMNFFEELFKIPLEDISNTSILNKITKILATKYKTPKTNKFELKYNSQIYQEQLKSDQAKDRQEAMAKISNLIYVKF